MTRDHDIEPAPTARRHGPTGPAAGTAGKQERERAMSSEQSGQDTAPEANTAPEAAAADGTEPQSILPGDQRSGLEADDISVIPSHVVAVGASAGGLEALERFFRAVPLNSGLCFVVIQHLSPDFRSMMGELLERFNPMPVVPVEQIEKVRPNTVFLLPPKKELVIQGNYLVPRAREKDGVLSLPINTFFYSLATEWGERSVAVVLSGTGSDGSKGVMEVRNAGGVILAQAPETAAFDGMPQSAIRTGCVDATMPPEDMPGAILSAASRMLSGLRDLNAAHLANQTGMDLIFEFLHHTYGINFSEYKSTTIVRRIERRVSLKHPPVTLDEYARHLATDAEELDLLYKDLLIGVTSFFRDPEVFAHLAENVIPPLLDEFQKDEEIRLWVAGCSTGEEAYSIAILVLEEMKKRGGPARKLKVIATDLHEDSLRVASDGIYPADSLNNAAAEFLKDYFIPTGEGHFKVSPALRKCLVFSKHNLLADPPFTRMHLVSCRNMLIYFVPKAQQKAIGSLIYSLSIKGVLLLGISENSGEHPAVECATHADRKYKVFHKLADYRTGHSFANTMTMPGIRQVRLPTTPQLNLPRIYESLLGKLVTSGILVNENHEVVHIFGHVDDLLSAPQGRFTGNLVRMLPQELGVALNSAFHKIEKDKTHLELRNIRADLRNGTTRMIDLSVQPIEDVLNKLTSYLVQFDMKEPPADVPVHVIEAADVKDSLSSVRMEDLERELRSTRETLQTTIEELGTTNEELQSANEELLSSNEELQSTNEELHSVNEELYSVNSEHEAKIEELNRTTNKLHFLMQSTDTATIFLDNDFDITLFMPGVLRIFSLLPKDIGRKLVDFKPRISDENLLADLSRLPQVTSIERELPVHDGVHWMRRCSLLFDRQGQQTGYVLNYTDVSTISRAEIVAENANARFDAFMDNMSAVAWISEEDGSYVYVSKNYQAVFNIDPAEAIGRSYADYFGEEDCARIARQEGEVWKTGVHQETVDAVQMPDGTQSYCQSQRFLFTGAEGRRYLGGLSVMLTAFQERISATESMLNGIVQKAPHGIAVFDRGGNCIVWNAAYVRILGLPEDVLHRPSWRLDDHVAATYPLGLFGFESSLTEALGECYACLREQRVGGEVIVLTNGKRILSACEVLDENRLIATFIDLSASRRD